MKIKRIGTIAALAALCVSCAAGVAAGQGIADVPARPRLVIAPVSLVVVESAPAKRPAVLPVLYATLGAVSAWDMYSTSAALKAGAVEGNPVVAPVASNTAGMLGLKLATAGTTIFFAERLWRKNRVAAIVMMAAINGATAAVAVRNIRQCADGGPTLRAGAATLERRQLSRHDRGTARADEHAATSRKGGSEVDLRPQKAHRL